MDQSEKKDLYLDLLKNTLTFSLWEEPPRPCGFEFRGKNPLKKYYFKKFLQQLADERVQLVRPAAITPYQRENGMIWPGNADTMVGRKRLDNLQFCIETVIREKVEGDLLGVGVWRGGSVIFMRAVLAALGVTSRKVYVAGSFRGLPRTDTKRFQENSRGSHHQCDYLAVPLEEVKRNFERYQMLDEQVVFIKGWFDDTFPEPVGKVSVLRADGVMYVSTMDILERLYPKLQPGGFCIIDDYGALKSCKKAVDDYRQAHQIREEMIEIDWTGRFWRKSF